MRSIAKRPARRWLLPLFAGALITMLASQSVLAAVSWTGHIKAGPALSWNIGHGLSTTTSESAVLLHEEFQDDRLDPVGIYYQRGDASELAWGLRKRMNPADEPGEYGAIAAAGTSVYVTYLASNHAANNYDPFAPRQVRVRVNADHGSSTAWLANKTINATGRAGLPTAAAAGAYGYVAFTDADSGDIVVASNTGANTEDAGWVTQTVGTTARINEEDGYEGNPAIAATGSLVLVAWIAADGGTLKTKISTDHGVTWPDTALTLSRSAMNGLSAAAHGDRLAVAWGTSSRIRVRVFDDAWGPTRRVAAFGKTRKYRVGLWPVVALAGTSRVAVAWSACTRNSCVASSTEGKDVRWRESGTNGASWKDPVTVASHRSSPKRRNNYSPSVVMVGERKRLVAYNTASANYSSYRLMIQLGSGKP
jgi:hypothetical protein